MNSLIVSVTVEAIEFLVLTLYTVYLALLDHYTEAQCARLIKQMVCSVRYIHSKGIIHRGETKN